MKNMKSSNPILSLGFLLFMLISSIFNSSSRNNEREFDYVRGGPIGPEKWGEINKEWSVCNDIGIPNDFLSKLEVNIASIINQNGRRVRSGIIDPRDIRMSRRRYYRYVGSLTVPPCTEQVVWMISRKMITVSKDQVTLLKEAVHDYATNNARPIQPDNK